LGGRRFREPHPTTTEIFWSEGLASLFKKPVNVIGSRVGAILDKVEASEGVDGFLDGGEERELEGGVLTFRSHGKSAVNEDAEQGLFFSEVAREAATCVGELGALEVAGIKAMFESILVADLATRLARGRFGRRHRMIQ
jgi:hypothetical protein